MKDPRMIKGLNEGIGLLLGFKEDLIKESHKYFFKRSTRMRDNES